MSALGHRHLQGKTACPLYPEERTCAVQECMSAKGQKRTMLKIQVRTSARYYLVTRHCFT